VALVEVLKVIGEKAYALRRTLWLRAALAPAMVAAASGTLLLLISSEPDESVGREWREAEG